MSKRFIETDLFRKPHIRALEGRYKLLWIYISCECDHAGVWEPELDVAGMRLKIDFSEEKVLAALADAVIVLDGGQWLLRDFIESQYGPVLNPYNRVHKSVLDRLERLSLEGKNKGLISHLLGAKDKDKDKKKDKESEGESEGKPKASAIEIAADEIYSAYPIKKGRDPAIKAIIRDLKAGEDSAAIIEAVKAFARSDSPKPHASTYFNQKRWKDEDNGKDYDPGGLARANGNNKHRDPFGTV